MQTWPLLKNAALARPGTVRFMSASAKTMVGDLPPSSRVTFFRLLWAAEAAMIRPTSVEPVKATLSTSGCDEIAAPAVWP